LKRLLLTLLLVLPLSVSVAQSGMVFHEVVPGSAAEKAGLLAGDG
jgi:S1-C subfamily serine protease